MVVLLLDDVEVASWPVVGVADLAMVDDLARLRLAACRLGYRVRLRHPGARLVELLRLTGLGAVLPADSGSCRSAVEVGGQPEGGEEVGVEEVVMTDDPVA